MNVSELYDLTYWVTEEIQKKQIVQKYQKLHSILQTNIQPNQQKQPFENQKNDLFAALKNVPLGELTRDQISFLENLGIANAVGVEGIQAIEEALYRNAVDVATLANTVQETMQSIDKGINKSNQIQAGLDDCVFEEPYESENEILMRVSFTGNALMEHVKDFKDWGKVWYEIGYGIAMAHNAAAEEIKVIGATKGSIVIELAVLAKIAGTTSGIILAALKVAEKVIEIRKKAEELRGLQLTNDKLADELEAEAENVKKEETAQITQNIALELNINVKGDGDKFKALDTAVKNLVNFTEKGGIVDFVDPENEEGEAEEGDVHKELKLKFEEIRQLEKKLDLLEHDDH